jgi:hypothetical protein
MHDKELTHLAVGPAVAHGPIEPGVTMVVFTEAERAYLLLAVADVETGPGASARLKLRAAAPVRDAGWKRENWRGVFRFLLRFLETDGRESGRCRWCKQRRRIDQYGLCVACLPSRRTRDSRRSPSDVMAHETAA